MTYSRIFQKLLNDDLNSYVYDATMAGSYYRVLCTPYGFSIALTGYSEKLLHLLEVVTSRILTLIDDMKGAISPELDQKFEKSRQSLLMETKNIRLDSPYELANYNSRMVRQNVLFKDALNISM
jgi:insulysin